MTEYWFRTETGKEYLEKSFKKIKEVAKQHGFQFVTIYRSKGLFSNWTDRYVYRPRF